MKKISLSIVLFSVVILGFSQQRAQFSQFVVNKYILNPAVGGTEDYYDIAAGYRSQWTGFTGGGAPNTYYVSGHGPINKEVSRTASHHRGGHKSWQGVGVYAYGDKTGPTSRNAFYASYSHNMQIQKTLRVSVGAFLGMQQFKVDAFGAEDIFHDEDMVLTKGQNQIVPDAMVGAWLYSRDFYAGISVHQVLQSKLKFDNVASLGSDSQSKLNNHYFLTGGVRLPMTHEITIIPSVLVKYVQPAPVSVDLDVKFDYDGDYFVALSYRVLDALTIVAGVVVSDHFEISYAYDLTTSKIRNYSFGSHELVIGYRFLPKDVTSCPSRFW